MRRTALLPLCLLCVPLLTASKCRKDKEVVEDDMGDYGDALTPDVELQLISMDPDRVEPGVTFRANVFGTAIEPGAEVWVGGTAIASVDVQSDNLAVVSVPPMDVGVYDIKLRNPDGAQSTLRGGLRVEQRVASLSLDCNEITVYFALDSSSLDTRSQATLREKSGCFDQRMGTVRVEGHCDERGTTDYNLALGQRRADTIERFLVGLGVTPGRVRTVSYGEERPAVSGSSESAWSANRRGEITIAE